MSRRASTTSRPTPPPHGYHVRWMIRVDLDTVTSIERASFKQAWSYADFVDEVRERDRVAMVVELPRSNRVAGYMIYRLLRRNLVLRRMAVHPDFRRCGLGRALINKLKAKLSAQRREYIECLVDDRDLYAHLFFSAMDFRADMVVRDCWADTEGDGYLFRYDLETTDAQ